MLLFFQLSLILVSYCLTSYVLSFLKRICIFLALKRRVSLSSAFLSASSYYPMSIWVLMMFSRQISLAELRLVAFVPDSTRLDTFSDQLVPLVIRKRQDCDLRQYLLMPRHNSQIFSKMGSFPQSRSAIFLYSLAASSPQSTSYLQVSVLLLSLNELMMLKMMSPLFLVSVSAPQSIKYPLFSEEFRAEQLQGKLTVNKKVLFLFDFRKLLNYYSAYFSQVKPRMKAEKKKQLSLFQIAFKISIYRLQRTATIQTGSLRLAQDDLWQLSFIPLLNAQMGKMKQAKSLGSFERSNTLLRYSRIKLLLKAQLITFRHCLASLLYFCKSALSWAISSFSLGSLTTCPRSSQKSCWYLGLSAPLSVYLPMQKLYIRKYLIRRVGLQSLQAGRSRESSDLAEVPRSERVMSTSISPVLRSIKDLSQDRSGSTRVGSSETLPLREVVKPGRSLVTVSSFLQALPILKFYY